MLGEAVAKVFSVTCYREIKCTGSVVSGSGSVVSGSGSLVSGSGSWF